MKFNPLTSQYNKSDVINIILSLIILLMLSMVFFKIKSSKEDFHSQRITFSILNQKLENLQPALKQFEIIEPEEYDEQLSKTSNISKESQPIIALVLDGLDVMRQVPDLPDEVNFGVEAEDNKENINSHNILLNLSLESEEETGSSELLINNSDEKNSHIIDRILAKTTKDQAVYSSRDETFTNYKAEFLLNKLKQSNLIYLCGKTDKNAIVYQLAKKMSFHLLENDAILDEVIFPDAINNKLLEIEAIALNKGSAIAMGSSYPLTIELLKRWISTLEDKGIKLVSINEFYKITKQQQNEQSSKDSGVSFDIKNSKEQVTNQ